MPLLARIDRYILAQLLALFGFFALVLVSVYWINRAVSLFDQLLADGQTAKVVLEFTALTLPFVIRVVLPIAAFAASIQVANRLSSDSELVVMQAAGLSPWRLARPVLVFGLIGALLMGLLTHWLVPASRAQLADRQAQIAQNVTAQFLNPGTFLTPTAGVTLYLRDVSPQGELLGLFLADDRRPERQVIHTADKALLVRAETGPKLIMLQGQSQTLIRHGDGPPRLSVTRFSDFTYDIGAMISRAPREGRNINELSTLALIRDPDGSARISNTPPAQVGLELHERLAQPFQAPVAALIGFAALLMGSFSRFGLTRQILTGIAGLIVVQFLSNAISDLARRQPDLAVLTWLAPLVGAGIAVAMLALAARRRRVPRAPAGGAAA
ncbi:LPS export ABC transporter permease LptF [Paracoccus sp. p4-l81]|uniref:LPS export ABC transporter permease LptF n=1 Tax=unclassified Paracoccus (in: a-proteobacteria) TaxID=2688777 RepID=UPI0035B99FF0